MATSSRRNVVADELAIRNLVGQLAQFSDDGELDEYIELVTEDAVIESGNGERRGRPQILQVAKDRLESGMSGRGTSRHVVTNTIVEIDDDTTASARSYFLFIRDSATNPTVQYVGRYHDEFRHADGTWRLARRQISIG